jgi:type II secretory ATPase GspE/PulE/Tfp pilus assembly ATPase PilB-like protein
MTDLAERLRATLQDVCPSELNPPDTSLGVREIWSFFAAQAAMTKTAIAQQLCETSGLAHCPHPERERAANELTKMTMSQTLAMCVFPVQRNGSLTVISADPFNEEQLRTLQFSLGRPFHIEVSHPEAIELAILQAFDKLSAGKGVDLDPSHHKQGIDDREVPALAKQIMLKAVQARASDLHLQPFVGGAALRMRVDGMLHRLAILPIKVAEALVRFFKAQGKMDPYNALIPQDGSMRIHLGEQEFSIRISTLPLENHNEKLVLRFLDQSASYQLSNNGFSLSELQAIRRLASHASGVVLLTGPTGSGKTTTLYALLNELNREDVSITTVENPVEYRMGGISQTEVNPKTGLTFASALRSILRQDPDVMLIGEIRDAETAQIALQSALTGHLVLSTLHTNDALTAIPRLLDLGIDSSILADALSGVVAQRLLRKLCEHCKAPTQEPLLPAEKAFKEITAIVPPFRALGCEKCRFTGYSGRIPITEILEITPALADAIASGETRQKVLKSHASHSLIRLAEAAERRIISGDTCVIEAMRVVGRTLWQQLANSHSIEVFDVPMADLGQMTQGNTGLLWVSGSHSVQADYDQSLSEAWFDVYSAHSPVDAKQQLEKHENIRFVVVDAPDGLNDQEIANWVANYRTAMAWSRLPALILLPEAHPEWEALLKAAGATSKMVPKPITSEALIGIISEALALNLDYSWEA